MKTVCALLILVVVASTPCFAKQVFNAMENEWETVPDNADVSPRFNPMENNFSMQPQDANLEFNAFNSRFEWDSGHNPD